MRDKLLVMTEQQSQNLLLKSTRFQLFGTSSVETVIVKVRVFCIEYIVAAFKAAV